jgi:hypothetical protein
MGKSISGEPLLTCFDCQRALTLEQLTLFPWWDERVNEFDVMYRCDRCLPKVRQQLLKQLAKKEVMLSSFVNFASRRVASKQLVAPPDRHGAQTLDYARHVLDEIISREAYVLS